LAGLRVEEFCRIEIIMARSKTDYFPLSPLFLVTLFVLIVPLIVFIEFDGIFLAGIIAVLLT